MASIAVHNSTVSGAMNGLGGYRSGHPLSVGMVNTQFLADDRRQDDHHVDPFLGGLIWFGLIAYSLASKYGFCRRQTGCGQGTADRAMRPTPRHITAMPTICNT